MSSCVGGVTEILDGHNGFAVNNDAELFVDAINSVLADYDAMSDSARRTYDDKFALSTLVDGYDKIYCKICQ